MKYKVIFDRNKCEDNLVCVAKCSKFWKQDDKGKVYLEGAEETGEGSNIFELMIDKADYECNKNAKNGCPKRAIEIKKE